MIAALLVFAGLSGLAGPTAYDHAEAGFKAYAAGDYSASVAAFDAALALKPDLGTVAAQRAYALKTLGRNKEAIRSFQTAMELGETGIDNAYAREIKTLENSFDLAFYSVYRDAAFSKNFLAVAGPSLTQSQSGLEAVWTPPNIGYRDGRLLQAFARVFWGYHGNSFRMDSASSQMSAGLRMKPFRATNLMLSAERLIRVGSDARNDWMLRASYSWDRGYALDGQRQHWRYVTFYADAAVIDPVHPDLFLASESRFGESFRLGSQTSITPHAMLAAVLQKDHYRTISIVETGPGVSVKYHGNDLNIELLAQYRQKLAGSSIDASGFVLTFVLQY
ncbi:NfrA family protein [Govanella unica]|uniref:Bacteriophage N4 adsorption protein A C-terminal domain-containing protein n=1 Tax=Govanella unica TaxID=2975056 RepID=A0A9X3TZF2_9PROT|nr:hypothetical protein [Govania unica]MDA5194289.1 hypothetical protein [Govania unica]